MTDETRAILEAAEELSRLMREHDVTRRYEECRARMKNDRKAQDCYAKLVAMGCELNERLAAGNGPAGGPSFEMNLLQAELAATPLVREYIAAQKEYLDVLKAVIERIKAPV